MLKDIYRPQGTHKVFLKRLREGMRNNDAGLRWNQLDVVSTIADFFAAPQGSKVTERDSRREANESPLTATRGLEQAALIESSPGSGKTRIMGYLAKKAAGLNGQIVYKPQQG